ncbi:MAG: sulfatase-like hydrolase/transferase, partial [Candidatus Tectomicrobia bacterium]|nr:sulfatase-like hydrolase/transferase [Candidatus Tectomicrobia bacterium]
MKSTKTPILLTLFVGGVLGYIAACNNVKPAADANAASEDKAEKTAEAKAASPEADNTANEQPERKPLQVAQAPAMTALGAASAAVGANGKKPNILVIWGDDIGISNISAYSRGMMGYQTPNIDRIAREGAIFTDYYGEQSCTAGRASFITGQIPFRTGLTKVGMPAAKQGLSAEDPTIAELLKNHGYVT